jgi:hypothetical protein
MEALASPATWGSPLGIAMVLISAGVLLAGLGVLVWGASHDKRAKATQDEVALKKRQFNHEHRRDEEA